ncbi:MAG: hypothetical protein B6D72_16165 [gamma proteobacterium symbiont of Ctena orbiculata]|nr:MAG: hypothetical protein B6D72_16165 [gamma proteobacterium symbiont of Ctena orbiculata]PVV23330.1 MAG: hypothetical protein B6D74_08015 [gamma proteobacterium symbiont of Ctena orbiculata]
MRDKQKGIGILLKKAMTTFEECYFRSRYLSMQVPHRLGMIGRVFADKAGNEVVAVIVIVPHI